MRDEETATKQAPRKRSGLITLAIWGDGVVGRILVLLLQSSGHEARFLPASSSVKPASLESIDLLVLTPTPALSAERRRALLSALRDVTEAARIPVLELVEVGASFEKPPEEEGEGGEGGEGGGARSETWQAVPWPCEIKELERRIALTVKRSRSSRGGESV